MWHRGPSRSAAVEQYVRRYRLDPNTGLSQRLRRELSDTYLLRCCCCCCWNCTGRLIYNSSCSLLLAPAPIRSAACSSYCFDRFCRSSIWLWYRECQKHNNDHHSRSVAGNSLAHLRQWLARRGHEVPFTSLSKGEQKPRRCLRCRTLYLVRVWSYRCRRP